MVQPARRPAATLQEDRGKQCPAKSAKGQRLGEVQSSGVRRVTLVAEDLWGAEVENRHRLEGRAPQKRANHAFGGVLDETTSEPGTRVKAIKSY